jgi:hypothetical protein
MWCLETISKINAPGYARSEPSPLQFHPRVLAVRRFVKAMGVPYEYEMRLKRSIHRYADQIVSRPLYRPEEGWSDEEAIQQVTLGDWNEECLHKLFTELT